ncbi:TapY2 family type IVa secretion system protein [Corallincola platygyrae]|uniref:TapY2 family type IVa secretion system protein n=1 Tax=Corallincola platygyrae TaxID=1193278 RepID=A0ABW4XPM6_9GAMM
MNKFLMGLVFSSVAASFQSLAASAEEEWKCYVMLDSGERQIVHYRFTPESNVDTESQLKALPVYADNGISQLNVKKYFECRPKFSDFENRKARSLEDKTPM